MKQEFARLQRITKDLHASSTHQSFHHISNVPVDTSTHTQTDTHM